MVEKKLEETLQKESNSPTDNLKLSLIETSVLASLRGSNGFLNGLMVGADPLGVVYSHFKKFETSGSSGWRNHNMILKEKFNDPTSKSYRIGKFIGAGCGALAQYGTYGGIQLAYIILNYLMYKKPVNQRSDEA